MWNRLKSLLGSDKAKEPEPDTKAPLPGSVHDSAPSSASAKPSDPPGSQSTPQLPSIRKIPATDNPWGVALFDVRPVTLTMASTSKDPRNAANAVSFQQDDGTEFIGQEPKIGHTATLNLAFPIDRMLADGVLFAPSQMEHKWAIFYHRRKIILVRSWLREVVVVADVNEGAHAIEITRLRGGFGVGPQDDALNERIIDFILRSHVLSVPYPAPLPAEMEEQPAAAALWCFSLFGNRALYATTHVITRRIPEKPLRSHSLLHIAVARGDEPAIRANLAAGIPIDLLAGDGLAPLHWALAAKSPSVIDLLLEHGSPIDVRSAEGATPLMNAVQGRAADKTALLLDRGADPSARDSRGFTALHRAAEMGLLEITRLLLARGADPNCSAEGHTPRSLAEQRAHPEIVALFDAG
jgi:hypothetical protein